MSELLKLYPRKYERADGGIIHPEWAGREIPVPPEWVRSRVRVPLGYEYATLADEMKLNARPRITCVEYVREWQSRVLPYGAHLIIAGSSNYRRLLYFAAATMNEVMRNYGSVTDVTVDWIGRERLSQIYEAKKSGAYLPALRQLEAVRLLFVREPARIAEEHHLRLVLEDIYDAREARRLPVITTLNGDLRDENFAKLKSGIGQHLCELLAANHHGFIAHL